MCLGWKMVKTQIIKSEINVIEVQKEKFEKWKYASLNIFYVFFSYVNFLKRQWNKFLFIMIKIINCEVRHCSKRKDFGSRLFLWAINK